MQAQAGDRIGREPAWRCPACGGLSLQRQDDRSVCDDCRQAFPVFSVGYCDLHWFYANAAGALAEWRARLRGFDQFSAGEQQRLELALSEGLSDPARQRITALLQARRAQAGEVHRLLKPFNLSDDSAGEAPSQVAKRQGLLSYYDNLFRDWAWDNGENESQWNALAAVLSPDFEPGSVVTLGGGGCRLAYDLHRNASVSHSTVLDINPLLVAAAARVIAGERLVMHEFPLAPVDSGAVRQTLSAPQALAAQAFSFVLGDASNPPFAPASFDTLLTPWLLDILDEDPGHFLRRLNVLLPIDGTWLNTGSLYFDRSDPAQRYGQEEFLALVADAGFEVLKVDQRDIDYLASPVSGHARRERILTFRARKIGEAPAPERAAYLPDWLEDRTRPVPQLPELTVAASDRLLQAQVLAAIDGVRSIDTIGGLVAKQYGLSADQATEAVRQILAELHHQLKDRM